MSIDEIISNCQFAKRYGHVFALAGLVMNMREYESTPGMSSAMRACRWPATDEVFDEVIRKLRACKADEHL